MLGAMEPGAPRGGGEADSSVRDPGEADSRADGMATSSGVGLRVRSVMGEADIGPSAPEDATAESAALAASRLRA